MVVAALDGACSWSCLLLIGPTLFVGRALADDIQILGGVVDGPQAAKQVLNDSLVLMPMTIHHMRSQPG